MTGRKQKRLIAMTGRKQKGMALVVVSEKELGGGVHGKYTKKCVLKSMKTLRE